MSMARISGLFEKDIKKIVALSTLRQLGLIVTGISLGLKIVVLFHLFNHAFFKALLFIARGTMIHSSALYQDLRKHGLASPVAPLTSSIVVLSNLSLMGFPFLSGFFSKDLIVERV